MTVTPANRKKAEKIGCEIHGHVYVYTMTCSELLEGRDDQQRVTRCYVCKHCGHQSTYEYIEQINLDADF